MKIIVGLGNPGEEYADTRHNAGWLVLDKLAGRFGLGWRRSAKLKSLIIDCGDLYLVKPQTFMNESGEAVRLVMSYYKILPQRFGRETAATPDLTDKLTVIHDELDLPLGEYKLSVDSRSAGHKGVQSIIDRLNTKRFTRVRIGIKSDRLKIMPAEKFVLERFNQEERTIIDRTIDQIVMNLNKI